MSTEIVYCAHSHLTKYMSQVIFKHVLSKGYIPIDPFIIFPSEQLDYFGYDNNRRLDLDLTILSKCDRLWIFGQEKPPFTFGVNMEYEWWKKNRSIRDIEIHQWSDSLVNQSLSIDNE